MLKKFSILACSLLCASGQTCRINVNPVTSTPLSQADATIVISRSANESQAKVDAEITRGFAGVRLEDGQRVRVNGEVLEGTRGDYAAIVNAADSYTIAVTDPRRGTDQTTIEEPDAFEITSPNANEDASLSGFMIEWTAANAQQQVEIEISQRLFGDELLLQIGPTEDDGNASITSGQLASTGFGQGQPMTIRLTKIRRVGSVSGFASATTECRVTESVIVNPAP
ncbi:MAG: hypothetical protein KF841_04350 [Phycisphaerae bacterium]|nr:hypothetical protein [Phycisphaerae bacterium]